MWNLTGGIDGGVYITDVTNARSRPGLTPGKIKGNGRIIKAGTGGLPGAAPGAAARRGLRRTSGNSCCGRGRGADGRPLGNGDPEGA